MASAETPQISTRKRPRQSRSEETVKAILEAAAQVLASEGATRFTTARVAERAGVSIGSLYQYFPNKAAILFRLQSEEWTETRDLLGTILSDTSQTPPERVRRLVHAFVRSECAEADLRQALSDAAPLYRDAPEAQAARASSQGVMRRFFAEALPDASDQTRDLAARMIKATMREVAKSFSETPRSEDEIVAWSDAMADMLCAYLESLGARDGGIRERRRG